jgi:hypothetical protein
MALSSCERVPRLHTRAGMQFALVKIPQPFLASLLHWPLHGIVFKLCATQETLKSSIRYTQSLHGRQCLLCMRF